MTRLGKDVSRLRRGCRIAESFGLGAIDDEDADWSILARSSAFLRRCLARIFHLRETRAERSAACLAHQPGDWGAGVQISPLRPNLPFNALIDARA